MALRWLVDAQLPPRLARALVARGHDALHTLELPNGNRTSDEEILNLCTQQNRTLITKDGDFVLSFLKRGRPERLLLISTGNVSNNFLIDLLLTHLDQIERALEAHRYVELRCRDLVIHQ